MKNIWKIALLFCFGLMTLTSCEAIEDLFNDEEEKKENPLVGVWSDNVANTMTFNSDGSGSWSWRWSGSNYYTEFTWQTSNKELNLNYDNSPEEETYSYKIEDNNTNLYLNLIDGTADAYYHYPKLELKRKK